MMDSYTQYVNCGVIETHVYTWYNHNGELQTLTNFADYRDHQYRCSYVIHESGRMLRTTSCESCGEVLALTECEVTVSEGVDLEYVLENNTNRFACLVTVEESGYYRYYSSDNTGDTYGEIYNLEGECMYANDDGGGNLNFEIQVYLEAGTSIYLVNCFLGDVGSNGTQYGVYFVHFDKV